MPSYPADPTPQQVLDARKAGGRVSVAWDAMRRILLDVINPALELANAQESRLYMVPRAAYVAPESLSGDTFPCWVIGASVGYNDFTPMQSELQGNAMVFLPYNGLLTQADIKDSNDILDIVVAGFLKYRGGHDDGQGNRCWSSLSPTQRQFLAGIPNWENVRGFAQHFNIVQYPNQERWLDS